jgi:DNA-binding transcriptional LysR family regulator
MRAADGLGGWFGQAEVLDLAGADQVPNAARDVLDAALAGLGLAYVPEDIAEPYLAHGRLVRTLEDWCTPWSGYRLYYPSRRQSSPAFALLVDALRYRDAPADELKA